MLTIITTEYVEPHRSQIISIRDAVFCREQAIDPSLEIDGLDEICLHAVAFSDNLPIATGRIQQDGHIGRIAVLKDFRTQGIGSKIISSLIDQAKSLELDSVYLASQVKAVSFYRKIGFKESGSIFIEAGIAHIRMKKMI